MPVEILPEFKALIPPLSEAEYEGLEKSLKTEGCRDAIVTWQGYIIDGHNRYEICQKHGITFETIETDLQDKDDVKAWMIQNQFSRRNISTFIRSELALKLKPIIAKQAEKNRISRRQNSDNEDSIDTKKELAKQAGVSHDTIARAEKILNDAPKEILDSARSGEMSVNQAHKETRRAIAKKQKEENVEKIKSGEVIAPVGQYDVVVLDPPWEMKKIEREVAPDQVDFDYPTMTEPELEILDIPFAENCHVFMWTTHKHLPMALRLFQKWGVKYVLTMVWHKNGGFQPFGLPQYNCEFILYGRVGTPVFIDTKAFPVCFDAPRGVHSKKPEEFYELLRRVTGGRRIDMFNRRKIDGFDTWGNESV